LILLPNIYWWRSISSNDAHFMWLIEILMLQVLTKGTHHLRNVKDRNQEETRREGNYQSSTIKQEKRSE
jgi:hypothetical protein